MKKGDLEPNPKQALNDKEISEHLERPGQHQNLEGSASCIKSKMASNTSSELGLVK
jgi:hypothetical protein